MEQVPLESSATHYWKKCVAEEELTSWDGGVKINIGDTYYEYIVTIRMSGVDLEMPENPIVTEKQYFKHVLQGRPGFNYFGNKK